MRNTILFSATFLIGSTAFADVVADWANCERQALPRMQRERTQNPTDASDQYCLGIGYSTGKIGQKDLSAAVRWLESAAAQNHSGAITLLGYHYERGYGVSPNPQKAFELYRRASDMGSADAAFNVGRAYENGIGVSQDANQAASWYSVAADRGNELAAKILSDQGRARMSGENGGSSAAQLFEEGKQLYLANDFAGAAEKFLQAANQNYAKAQLQIGSQYERGEGVTQNDAEAAKWYGLAADQGDPVAQKNLGMLFEEGRGLAEDWIQAARLYQASARQHYKEGQFALGRAYQFGIGVPQNRAQAIAWFEKAAAQTHPQASFFARHLAQRNFIGFRDDREHDLVIGNRLRFSLNFQEPAGRLFRNSAERDQYLVALRSEVDLSEANTMWDIRKREYDDCQRSGSSGCSSPGPAPGN